MPMSMRPISPRANPRSSPARRLSHLMFARRRRRTALVRVFNPTLREHGYVSPHTVIEMVNDDMPFLVDSISLALTERSLTLHFLTHPIFAVTRDGSGNLLVAARTRRCRRGDEAVHRKETAPGVLSARRGGSHRRSRGLEIPRSADRAQHARRARGLRGLGENARRHPAGVGGIELLERTLRCRAN